MMTDLASTLNGCAHIFTDFNIHQNLLRVRQYIDRITQVSPSQRSVKVIE